VEQKLLAVDKPLGLFALQREKKFILKNSNTRALGYASFRIEFTSPKQAGQYLAVASILAHASQTSLLHLSQVS